MNDVVEGRGPRWSDLVPDPKMTHCLNAADATAPRRQLLNASAPEKNNWSNRFADACAKMVADEARAHREVKRRRLTVLPARDGSAEPPVVVLAGQSKRIDVTASSLVSGLEVCFSLKGLNFRDRDKRKYDKNLTGRTYELQEEARLVHTRQPTSFFTALYFMPLAATMDGATESSFAHTVRHLRGAVGRSDAFSSQEARRSDMAFVALYVPGDEESFTYGVDGVGSGVQEFNYKDELQRGVVGYFDVSTEPPRQGRPRLSSPVHTLAQMVDRAMSAALAKAPEPDWAEPEL